MNPKVSVIVPVYDVENYLNRCIDSILTQTFTDFELILIDDGSPDNCPKMCDEYAKKDKRVKVIHQKNGGVSVARNAGLDEASGDWICFVDSDDYIECKTIELLIENASNGDFEIIQFDYILEGEGQCRDNHEKLKDEILEIKPDKDIPWWFGMCWNRMYSRAMVEKNGIRFPEGLKWMEDTYFSYASLASTTKIKCISKSLYHYYYWTDSAVNNLTMKHLEGGIKVVTLLEKFLIQNNNSSKFKTILFNQKLWKKEAYIINLKNPDFEKFMTVFPEINNELLTIKNWKKKKLYSLILKKHYFLAKILIKLLNIIKTNNLFFIE